MGNALGMHLRLYGVMAIARRHPLMFMRLMARKEISWQR